MDNSNKQFFIGIDVSKPYFDASVLPVINHVKQEIVTEQFLNTPTGIKSFSKWLKANKVTLDEKTLLVIENTGIYHRLLWIFCCKHNLPIHIGNAAHIKWSFGIARGKNDKIDSIRLCNYAFKEGDTLKSTPALNPTLLQLKDLMTSRTLLVTQVGSIKKYLRELKDVSDKSVQGLLEKANQNAIEGLTCSINSLESEIAKIILDNKDLKKNYDLVITVPGIGHFTAVYLICCTNNFSGKISGKQLACYAGVVPFEYRSGISVKGRNKVHPMANKDLKKLLHLCALSAIQHYLEFKQYYERKKLEGKHSMSVINAVRNKIVLRVMAVVNNQTPYVNNVKKTV